MAVGVLCWHAVSLGKVCDECEMRLVQMTRYKITHNMPLLETMFSLKPLTCSHAASHSSHCRNPNTYLIKCCAVRIPKECQSNQHSCFHSCAITCSQPPRLGPHPFIHFHDALFIQSMLNVINRYCLIKGCAVQTPEECQSNQCVQTTSSGTDAVIWSIANWSTRLTKNELHPKRKQISKKFIKTQDTVLENKYWKPTFADVADVNGTICC